MIIKVPAFRCICGQLFVGELGESEVDVEKRAEQCEELGIPHFKYNQGFTFKSNDFSGPKPLKIKTVEVTAALIKYNEGRHIPMYQIKVVDIGYVYHRLFFEWEITQMIENCSQS